MRGDDAAAAMKMAQKKMELSAPGLLPCFPAKEALVDEDVEQQMRSGKDEGRAALPWWLLMSLLVFVRGSEDDQHSHAELDRGYTTSTSRTASKRCRNRSLIKWLWFITGIT